jgi:hypothetical protein
MVPSSGIQVRVVRMRTDVWEDYITSIFRVEISQAINLRVAVA